MNANVKYLISSDEREAENNPLWREVAEGEIWDQKFMTRPTVQPTHALLAVHQVQLLSHHEAAPPSLIKLPITLPAAQQRHGASADGTLHSLPRNEALCQRPNAQPHIANHPNTCHSSPFSIYFYPSVLGRTKARMYF